MKFSSIRVPLLISGAVALIVCLLAVLSRHLAAFDIFQHLEWITFDWRVRQAAAQSPSTVTNLGFVYVRNESIDALLQGALDYRVGLYWPRHVYGRLINELSAQGAKAVGFDVLFGELRPDHDRAEPLPDGSHESDKFFARALQAAGNVVLAADKGVLPVPLFRTNAWTLGDIGAKPESDGILRRARAFDDFYVWHPLIKQGERLEGFDLRQARFESNRLVIPFPNGTSKIIPLQGGQFDQVKMYEEYVGQKPPARVAPMQSPATKLRTWNLGIVLAARELDLDLSKARDESADGRIVLPGKSGVERIIPVDREGRFYVDWCMKYDHKALTRETIEALLMHERDRRQGKMDSLTNRWANKLVVVGTIATGNDLGDLGPTPLDKQTFLASRYWNVANSVIQNRFIRPPSLPILLGFCVLMCALAGLLTVSLRSLAFAAASLLLLAVLYVVVARYLFVSSRIWLPLVMPLAGLVLTHAGLTTYQAFFEESERRRIKAVFEGMVSPNIVTELLKADRLSLEGGRRSVTVSFTDVRGFTEMTDDSHAKAEAYVRQQKLDDKEAEAYFDAQTQQLLKTVNLYLSLIADIVKKNDGTLDKYIGDCVMAFWGAPTPNARHALSAVRSAIEVQRAIEILNLQRAAENTQQEQENQKKPARRASASQPLRVLSLGTGINTGSAIVGLMGSRAHIQNYTVFGREVNLASRLEGLSARGRIIIGEATYLELLQDDPALATSCLELSPATVKGFRLPVKIFEVPWQLAGKPATSALTDVEEVK